MLLPKQEMLLPQWIMPCRTRRATPQIEKRAGQRILHSAGMRRTADSFECLDMWKMP
jgi:hypothetical protein